MDDALMKTLVADFVSEAGELCDKVTAELLALEQASAAGGDLAKSYTRLARGLHTLKGSAHTLGLEDLAALAHAMEDLVAPHQRAARAFPKPAADAILAAVDTLQARLAAHASGHAEGLPDVALAVRALRASSAGTAAPAAAAPTVVAAAAPTTAPAAPRAPAPVTPPVALVAPPEPAPEARKSEATAESAHEDAGWRVSPRQIAPFVIEVERLREIRLRAAEARRDLLRAITMLDGSAAPDVRVLLGGVARVLASDAELTGEVIGGLEEGVKAICTLAVRTILDPLARTVRDLCRATGKQARLSVLGAEVSLDRRTLEALKGPIVHLLRNAVDHGLETPAERERQGKHPEGALVIRVEQQGNTVFLEMSDDGNGIDVERVRAVAVERGLLGADAAARMSPSQLQQLIFQPGFSTRQLVSETSGRGVGLDVVDTEVRRLDGRVEVQSIAGQGTRFILSLPAGIGSTPVVVLRCGEHVFAIPTLAVLNILPAQRTRLRLGPQQMRLEHREQILPLQDLGVAMGLRQPQPPRDGQPILVVGWQGSSVALAVDEVLGDRDAAIHPLPADVDAVPAYLGACVQARGDLLLVLRPEWLVKAAVATPAQASAPRRALVVDDSLTARAMHRTSLEAGGYAVHTASSGRHALEQLGQTSYDVIVCDIGMDEMDGIAFTAEVRRRPATQTVPILLVSALVDEGARASGLAAGADGFLSKTDCMAGRLLAEVAAVVAQRRKAA